MAGINLNNIRKTYAVDNQKLSVLKGVDLHIPEKKITVVLGRSGCGKTTLLRIVGGLRWRMLEALSLMKSTRWRSFFKSPG